MAIHDISIINFFLVKYMICFKAGRNRQETGKCYIFPVAVERILFSHHIESALTHFIQNVSVTSTKVDVASLLQQVQSKFKF